MEYLTVEPLKGNIKNILVMIDFLPSLPLGIQLENKQQQQEDILNEFIVHYGLPRKLYSDQGENFCTNIK